MFYSQVVNPNYGIGAGDFLRNAAPTAMEYSMVRWLEHEGYDVTYITDVDTHEDVNRLLRGKAFLSVGHDEYWSEAMKANVVQARDQGVSLGFFGSNCMYFACCIFFNFLLRLSFFWRTFYCLVSSAVFALFFLCPRD
jgi:hypothetical protein